MKNKFASVTSMHRPRFAKAVVYMLQAGEYQVGSYLRWLWRADDFSRVMHRRQLIMTRPARLLLAAFNTGVLLQIIGSILLIWLSFHDKSVIGLGLSVALLLSAPIVWAHLIVLPLALGRWLIIRPTQAITVRRSEAIFAAHPGTKIAIAGSYGKTTMKEMLATVLAEGKKVAATPANRNVAISHAQFAAGLSGDEDILIIEYGEGAPGDVARFTKITHPTIGVITGLAPAHLDKYKTLQAAGHDIFSLADYLGGKNVYVNNEGQATKDFIKKSYVTYSAAGVGDWKISDIKNGLDGLSFKMKNPKEELNIKSRLLGMHQVGPLGLVAALAYKLGLSTEQIEAGASKIKPFEHRMQIYELAGAHIIDDTYNGNIEGLRAGLQLLTELPASRKIYITPGLVDQGTDSAAIHRQLGEAIAKAEPNITILMKHAVTGDIIKGIEHQGYKGQLVVEDDPLNFYTHLDKFVATGDLVLMQNDWPDNYV